MQYYSLFIGSLICLIIFLVGVSVLSAFNIAILKLGKFQTKETLNSSNLIFKNFFLREKWDRFYLLASITKNILFLSYAVASLIFVTLIFPNIKLHHAPHIFLIGFIIIFVFLTADFIMRLIVKTWAKAVLKSIMPITFVYIIVFLVLTYPFLILTSFFTKKFKKEEEANKAIITKDKVLEMIKDSELSLALSASDQMTIASFITFKEKAAREIMIPRIDIFALDAKTTIKNACIQLLEENYSRIPIYNETLDNIVGVLMYKDLLKILTKSEDDKELLNKPIENFVKPIIYAPENKKISKLFLEFKNKKTHLAIIVNEYGGTEGIVTIEDILEEMVGEIKDEYDIEEEKQYWQLPTGSFVIDAKMNIIDLEDQLKIKIPHSPEYETIGGYIFHIAGTIPSKGWKIHLEDFDIEVLISNERCIEKIRITPASK
ncbi:MAG: hemolysin family protein [Parachlamydiales bacterium]|jgi:CBS domain containing-hemolysin-like protein